MTVNISAMKCWPPITSWFSLCWAIMETNLCLPSINKGILLYFYYYYEATSLSYVYSYYIQMLFRLEKKLVLFLYFIIWNSLTFFKNRNIFKIQIPVGLGLGVLKWIFCKRHIVVYKTTAVDVAILNSQIILLEDLLIDMRRAWLLTVNMSYANIEKEHFLWSVNHYTLHGL